MKKTKLMMGDNIELLKKLPDNSIDSVVTDPPYALTPSKNAKVGFMGKLWDSHVPSIEFWKECLRVLKPGGHVLSFGGTRTYHRMVVNMEDAGFEIRDQIMWIYGSGFPKSLNIGKQIQKMGGDFNYGEIKKGAGSKKFTDGSNGFNKEYREIIIDNDFEGQGTGLKPANEPICLARKPISEKTITENVLKWGTGGINVDGCRIEGLYGKGENEVIENKDSGIFSTYDGRSQSGHKKKMMVSNPEGRFPANILFDEEAAKVLDGQSGISKSSKFVMDNTGYGKSNTYINRKEGGSLTNVNGGYVDSGGASRFFYVAKVSSKERNLGLGDDFEDKDSSVNLRQQGGLPKANSEYKVKNNHPTLKPINLMTYLCRLVTPKNGIILDPFMGSGSTGISALLEGFRFVGMEMDEGYFKIAESRIQNYEKYRDLLK